MKRAATFHLAPPVGENSSLGNQLFQLAFGIYLQSQTGQQIRFTTASPRHPKLSVEDSAIGPLLNPDEICSAGILYTYLSKFMQLISQSRSINESTKEIDFRKFPTSIKYISGYFQESRYAIHSASNLFERFAAEESFKHLLSPNVDRIAVHIRLGDYERYKSIFGQLPIQYFVDGISYLSRKLELDQVIVISDDIQKAKTLLDVNLFGNLKVAFCDDTKQPLEDLAVISSSRGVVTSNSSFSWWGAFIASVKGNAHVVYPNPWLPIQSTPPKHLVLDSWKPIGVNYL